MGDICKHCGRPLSEAQWKDGYKSCPMCSKLNGEYHVFHKYPDDFGVTERRSTAEHPEGPQSYCERCRGKQPPLEGLLCSDF